MKIVLLPGMDGTGFLFEPLMDLLDDGLVLAYPTNEALGYKELEERLLERLPTEEPFVLLGESFGGPLALRLAHRRPPNLKGVILCATFINSPHPLLPPWLAPLCRGPFFRLFPVFVTQKATLGGYLTPRLRALLGRVHREVNPKVLALRVREILSHDVSSLLAVNPYPILYLRGLRDRVVPQRNLDRVLAVNPRVFVSKLDAPHLLLQTAPSEALVCIRAFLERLEG